LWTAREEAFELLPAVLHVSPACFERGYPKKVYRSRAKVYRLRISRLCRKQVMAAVIRIVRQGLRRWADDLVYKAELADNVALSQPSNLSLANHQFRDGGGISGVAVNVNDPRTKVPDTPQGKLQKVLLAAIRSRYGDNMKSMVLPSESSGPV